MKLLRVVVEPEMRLCENRINLKPVPRENTFGCKNILWKEERVRLLVGSLGASTTLIYSPGSSTPPRYYPGSSTPPSYSLRTSRNAEC
ncbi:hypothetical protein Tco_0980979 [Tanacetum coccineum]